MGTATSKRKSPNTKGARPIVIDLQELVDEYREECEGAFSALEMAEAMGVSHTTANRKLFKLIEEGRYVICGKRPVVNSGGGTSYQVLYRKAKGNE